ncbi:nucleotidyltransferase family protein [Rathayibacter sp. PhB127]|uniref:nucleotidyltransferase family protein n=1 Tax=Rathayibacter sp. PhB127 TaxID=2485176 RepID=UPI00160C6687|nr:nucleotidyltransferase family protein [Rathayibacter sp. PhB127]
MTGAAILPSSVATRFAHVLCHRLAQENGVRLLSIKGPVAMAEGLRPPYTPSDADVLVDPNDADRFVEILGALGWRARPSEGLPRLLEEHSVTLINDRWPCDIDVHRRFPGFLAADDQVFDLMWNDRSAIDIAGVACDAPPTEANWAIAVLHVYRDGWKSDQSASDGLIEFARRRFARESLAGLVSWVKASGAMATLEPAMTALGVYDASCAVDSVALARWRIRREAGLSPALPLIVELAEGRLLSAATLCWKMLTASSHRRHKGESPDRRPLVLRVVRTLPALPRWVKLVRRSLRTGPE